MSIDCANVWANSPHGAAARIDHLDDARGTDHRHDIVGAGETTLHVQRIPRRGRFVLGEAERVLGRLAEGGHVDLARLRSADVLEHETHGPADGGIGPVARPQGIRLRIHPDANRTWTVHDHQGRRRTGGGRNADEIEIPVGEALYGRGDETQVFGLASGHHRVDGQIAPSHRSEQRRKLADHGIGVACMRPQHALDSVRSRRHDGQPVAGPGGDHLLLRSLPLLVAASGPKLHADFRRSVWSGVF
jgi:hypothetical protein